MFLAILAEKSVGRAIASSRAFVWSDWVPPSTALKASTHVLVTLLNGSCSVRLHPEVWQWVLSMSDAGFSGLKVLTILAQSILAALIFAISMKWSMPIPQKKEILGAKSSMLSPRPDARP